MLDSGKTSGEGAGMAVMRDEEHDTEAIEDGRPAEVREGEEPQPAEEAEEDIADPSTVESVGY